VNAGPSDEIEMRFAGLGSWFRLARIIAQSNLIDHGVISAFIRTQIARYRKHPHKKEPARMNRAGLPCETSRAQKV
jgi:hypothetical protein